MKTIKHHIFGTALALLMSTYTLQAQEIDNLRPLNQDGLNVFEAKKGEALPFDGVKVKVGGDFALQFQGISQENTLDSLQDLEKNFNLPSANLNLDVQLAKGVRMHLRTYLSSRHHVEAYVKGGYLQMDNLDFISEGFLSGVMNVTTLTVGMDEINYGDTHFRRSDNARALYNPFVGNYIMDAFTTEPFAEATIQKSGVLVVLGATNGKLNQSVLVVDDNAVVDKGVVLYGKLGFDKQINDDLRVRLTGSFYTSNKGTRDYLYGGDRAGSRYYEVLNLKGTKSDATNDFSGRYNTGFKAQTAFQVNPFIKFQGVEFFGVFETVASNEKKTYTNPATGAVTPGNDGSYTQLGAELLYRFGTTEQFFLGGRYNSVSGESVKTADTRDISRINVGGGWFMTKNIVTKVEYVTQSYDGDGFLTDKTLNGAQFNGVVVEAAISF